MARSDLNQTTTRRILGANQEREERADRLRDNPESLLSRRTNAAASKPRKKRRRAKSFGATFKLIVLCAVVLSGIALILWLRQFAGKFGIVWIGDF